MAVYKKGFDTAFSELTRFRASGAPEAQSDCEQVIRSGISVGANTSEAQQAFSKRDFVSKMSIALKECKETKYWLDVIKQSEILTENDLLNLSREADELCVSYSTIVR